MTLVLQGAPRFRWLACTLALSLPAVLPGSALAGLSLEEAERLAAESDPAVHSVLARKLAMEELSVAARQLPDPTLKFGVMSLPVDSFEFDDEPMTEAQIGLVQKFPRGRTRELRSEQIDRQAAALNEMARDRKLRTLLAVREEFLEVLGQTRRSAINGEAIKVFSDFAGITRDYYATGRVHQQDVLQAAVELGRAEERAYQIAEEEEQARARLATWIGEAALRPFDAAWPELAPVPPAATLYERLELHPRIGALQQRVVAAETGVELTRQRYKPEFSVDLAYGARSGVNPDGSSLPDLLSFMVMMDLPLFHDNRQDRLAASSLADANAAMFERDDAYRRMKSEVDQNLSALARQQERRLLFEKVILPEARFSAESSFQAYQSSVGDLTALLRAQITEFELQLEYASLQADSLKTRARLLYLEGSSS